jgi:hypothetical protein
VRYLVRAAVNRKTNEVVVEANPQRAITPSRSGSLIALTIVSPMVLAACLTLLQVLFDVSGPGTWPSLNVLAGYFLIGWPICQIGVLLIVRQTLHTSAPIRLPDGTVTRVDRIWLRKT